MDWKESNNRIDVPYNKNACFISIDYPGIVQNTENAIESLGGAENLSKIHSESTKRIPLCWRPDDVYCRPVYGDRHNTNGLLMRVRRRRKKTEGAKYEYKVQMLGTIQVTYKFQAMSDFQYLPVQRKDDGQYKSIYDQVVLNKLTSHKEYFSRDAPLFMPPLVFSRVDTPCDFLVRPDIAHKQGYKNPDMKRAPHLIGTVREKRTIYTIFVNYGEPVPERPIEAAVKRMKSKFVNPDWETQIKKLFEEKPLHLKVEIEQRLGYSKDKLKMVLPALCYYWLDGPWRAQWNKFGFDPTKNVEAKIYQTLDFRIRQFKPGQKVIQPKRSSLQKYRYTQQVKSKPLPAKISLDTLGETKDDNAGNSAQDKEILYHYFPDKIPVQRLTYYQLCYIHLDEVQELVHSNDAKETKCSERDGWCAREVIDKCRDIMYTYTERLLSKDETVQQSFTKRLKRKKKKRKYLDEEEGDDVGAAAGADNDDDDVDDYADTAGTAEMDVDEG